jgi:MFS family permease
LQGAPNRKLYYGWVVVWVVFAALLVSAGVRAAPTVLINPLESELGWGRATISAAVSIGLLLYGLSGPAAGWLMDRFGPKPLTLFGLVLIGLSTLMGAAMTELWQLNLFWGVLSGLGTGVVAPVLGPRSPTAGSCSVAAWSSASWGLRPQLVSWSRCPP